MVLVAGKLERYGISKADVQGLITGRLEDPYAVINVARMAYFEKQYSTMVQEVEKLRNKHDATIHALAALRRGDDQKVVHDFLLELNSFNYAVD